MAGDVWVLLLLLFDFIVEWRVADATFRMKSNKVFQFFSGNGKNRAERSGAEHPIFLRNRKIMWNINFFLGMEKIVRSGAELSRAERSIQFFLLTPALTPSAYLLTRFTLI